MAALEEKAFTVVALGPDTWELFEGLASRHNGVSAAVGASTFTQMALNGDKAQRQTAN